MKFTIKDRQIISDSIVPCFPKQYKINELFESEYNQNVETVIFPILEDKEKLRKSPGLLIILASWMESYLERLRQAGVENAKLPKLIDDIKKLMPLFIDHVEEQLNGEI